MTVIARSPHGQKKLSRDVRAIQGNTARERAWQKAVSKTDAVINLVGAPIFARWNDKTKWVYYRVCLTTPLLSFIRFIRLLFIFKSR